MKHLWILQVQWQGISDQQFVELALEVPQTETRAQEPYILLWKKQETKLLEELAQMLDRVLSTPVAEKKQGATTQKLEFTKSR